MHGRDTFKVVSARARPVLDGEDGKTVSEAGQKGQSWNDLNRFGLLLENLMTEDQVVVGQINVLLMLASVYYYQICWQHCWNEVTSCVTRWSSHLSTLSRPSAKQIKFLRSQLQNLCNSIFAIIEIIKLVSFTIYYLCLYCTILIFIIWLHWCVYQCTFRWCNGTKHRWWSSTHRRWHPCVWHVWRRRPCGRSRPRSRSWWQSVEGFCEL